MRTRRQVNICAQADGVADNVKAVAGSRGIPERFSFWLISRLRNETCGGTVGARHRRHRWCYKQNSGIESHGGRRKSDEIVAVMGHNRGDEGRKMALGIGL
jgi:hypothetical protein